VDVSDCCGFFGRAFYGLLFGCLAIADVALRVHRGLPVSFLLCIAAGRLVGSAKSLLWAVPWVLLSPRLVVHKKMALARLACLCFFSRFSFASRKTD